ncbi:MAG: hypothetical protein Q7S28_02175 [bacterium]|nr:hypothetical protein [bacterium]
MADENIGEREEERNETSVEEAAKKGGDKVRHLVEEGKEAEGDRAEMDLESDEEEG